MFNVLKLSFPFIDFVENLSALGIFSGVSGVNDLKVTKIYGNFMIFALAEEFIF